MQDNPIITLTTDFGYKDPFVGVMKGVILKINPLVKLIDITHGIKSQDIREAAFVIGTSYKFFSDNTIHVVVVDPEVGSGRRPIIVNTDHHYFIGPDNGVFSYVYHFSQFKPEVIHITADHYFLSSKSPTFQGRDVFCPIAAWFSRGIWMSKFGDPITDFQTIAIPTPRLTTEGTLRGEVIHIDYFGNAITNITKSDLDRVHGPGAGGAITAMLKGREIPFRRFYAEAEKGKVCSLINSMGFLELFLYRGSAAAECNISVSDVVEITVSVQ
jgi:S-adenosyl-L-methionine hydrolase (adenosine-forming)